MNYSFEYLDIILLAMIAGFIFLRLRGILGKKSGYEDDISSVSIAIFLLHDDVRIKEIRIALGGVGETALRVYGVEKMMRGGRFIDIDWGAIADALDATISPISDVRASADYRRNMAHVSIKEIVEQFFLRSSGA